MYVPSCENLKQPDFETSAYQHLYRIIETPLDIICTIDEEGRFVWLNKAATIIWGYSLSELVGRKYIDFVLESDKPKTEKVAQSIINGTNFTSFQNQYRHKNGTTVPIEWSATWVPSEKLMYCVARDASEKWKTENELMEKSNLLKKALQTANMVVWEYDVETETTIYPDELKKIYGFEQMDADVNIVDRFYACVHPDDLEKVREQFNQIPNISPNLEHRFIRPDGKLIYLKQCVSFIQNKNGIVTKMSGLVQDITESRVYQEKIKANERRFESMLQSGTDMVGVIDMEGNYKYVGTNTKDLLGYDAESLCSKNAFEFIHPDDADCVKSQLEVLATEKHLEVKPFRFKNAAGEWRWIETRVTNFMDDPAIEGLVVNSRDITEKKRTEDHFANLSHIAEQTNNAVVITDREGQITWVNSAFEKITGYSSPEVLGKKPGALLQGPGSDLATVTKMKECIKKVKPFDVEIINYTKANKPYWIQINCQPRFDAFGKLHSYFAIQTDITEKKRLEYELRNEVSQRQKDITMAMLNAQERERSQLSKELHDNVNQILTTVKLYLEMAQDGAHNSAVLVAKAKDYVLTSINEIRHITKRLAAPEQVELRLEEAVKELIGSLSLAGKMTFDLKLYGLSDYQPKEQISLAIYRIAQEHLTNVVKHSGATQVKVTLSVIAGNLSFRVEDNGKGFNVFKKRKGIGISNMYNRVETLNGRLHINSREGEGCTLLAIFPLVSLITTHNKESY